MVRSGTYRHYKGKFYNVLGTAQHSETLEDMIIYQELYGNYGFWVRPKSMFYETVMVGNKSVPRFEFVSETHPHIATPEISKDEK